MAAFDAERQVAEVEFDLEVSPLIDARSDPRQIGQLLAAQASETDGALARPGASG